MEEKRRGWQPAARWMDSVTMAMNAVLENMRDQDYHGEILFM